MKELSNKYSFLLSKKNKRLGLQIITKINIHDSLYINVYQKFTSIIADWEMF